MVNENLSPVLKFECAYGFTCPPIFGVCLYAGNAFTRSKLSLSRRISHGVMCGILFWAPDDMVGGECKMHHLTGQEDVIDVRLTLLVSARSSRYAVAPLKAYTSQTCVPMILIIIR